MSNSKNRRYSLVLDMVDADHIDNEPLDGEISLKQLALIRIVTTAKQIKNLTQRDRLPEEGEWLEVGFSRSQGYGPPFWAYSAEEDYSFTARGSITSLQFRDSGDGPAPVGANTAPSILSGKRLRKRFNLSELGLSLTALKTLFHIKKSKFKNKINAFDFAVVEDVGQANLCRLEHRSTKVSIFIDIGEPLPFHFHTMIKDFQRPKIENALVILTHWDWDHVAAGRERKSGINPFAKILWIAPTQIIGPNTFERIARPHFNRGRLLILPPKIKKISVGPVQILACSGDDQNNSGLAVITSLVDNRRILFPGDAQFGKPTMPVTGRFDSIVISHHGAATGGPIPPKRKRTSSQQIFKAAVSVGNGNKYNHPDSTLLSKYTNSGWSVVRTDMKRNKSFPGDIRL